MLVSSTSFDPQLKKRLHFSFPASFVFIVSFPLVFHHLQYFSVIQDVAIA